MEIDEILLYAIKVLKDSKFTQQIFLGYAIILVIFLSLSYIWQRVSRK